MNKRALYGIAFSFFTFAACVPYSFSVNPQNTNQSSLAQYKECSPFDVLQQEIDNFFWHKEGIHFRGGERLRMKLDIVEAKEGNITILAELPGIHAKDISVSILGNVLKIEGEKKVELDENKENAKIRERVYGSFSRSINLPFEPDAEKVAATFTNGVLKIEIPKSGNLKEAKKIQIKI